MGVVIPIRVHISEIRGLNSSDTISFAWRTGATKGKVRVNPVESEDKFLATFDKTLEWSSVFKAENGGVKPEILEFRLKSKVDMIRTCLLTLLRS